MSEFNTPTYTEVFAFQSILMSLATAFLNERFVVQDTNGDKILGCSLECDTPDKIAEGKTDRMELVFEAGSMPEDRGLRMAMKVWADEEFVYAEGPWFEGYAQDGSLAMKIKFSHGYISLPRMPKETEQVPFGDFSALRAWEEQNPLLKTSFFEGNPVREYWNYAEWFLKVKALEKGLGKKEMIRMAAGAIRKSGLKLPWNAATWGPTAGRSDADLRIDPVAEELVYQLVMWMGMFEIDDSRLFKNVVESCQGPGMNSPLTSLNIWDLVKAGDAQIASTAVYQVQMLAEDLLEKDGLKPMLSAIGENLLWAMGCDPRNDKSWDLRMKEIAQRVAEKTLEQYRKTHQ